jgi:hypothetical protein
MLLLAYWSQGTEGKLALNVPQWHNVYTSFHKNWSSGSKLKMAQHTGTHFLSVKKEYGSTVGIFHPHSFSNNEVSEAVSGSFFIRKYTVEWHILNRILTLGLTVHSFTGKWFKRRWLLIQRGDFSISTSRTESPMFALILVASFTKHPSLRREVFHLNTLGPGVYSASNRNEYQKH